VNLSAIMQELVAVAMFPVHVDCAGHEPNLLVGYRGLCVPLKVKAVGKSEPNVGEKQFAATWPGPYAIVTDGRMAIDAVLAHAKAMDRI
jgi:hypothetical protein